MKLKLEKISPYARFWQLYYALREPKVNYVFVELEAGELETRLDNAFDILFDEMDKSPNVDKL
jgi:hypothetical protein